MNPAISYQNACPAYIFRAGVFGCSGRKKSSAGHTGEKGNLSARKVLKQGDDTAHADHRQHRAQPHAHQMTGEQQPQQDGEGDVAKVKTVFGEADAPVQAVREGLTMPSPGLGTIRMESDMAAPTPVNRIASSSTTRRRGNRSDQPAAPAERSGKKAPNRFRKRVKTRLRGICSTSGSSTSRWSVSGCCFY